MQRKIDLKKAASAEQIKMLEEATKKTIPADSDYPEFSEEELAGFRRISEKRKSSRQKQNITLRLSPESIQRARSLGKGYTSVLSRILEEALEDPEKIKQHL